MYSNEETWSIFLPILWCFLSSIHNFHKERCLTYEEISTARTTMGHLEFVLKPLQVDAATFWCAAVLEWDQLSVYL